MLKSRLLKMCPRMMQPSLVTIAMGFNSQGTIVIFATNEVTGGGGGEVGGKGWVGGLWRLVIVRTLHFQEIIF